MMPTQRMVTVARPMRYFRLQAQAGVEDREVFERLKEFLQKHEWDILGFDVVDLPQRCSRLEAQAGAPDKEAFEGLKEFLREHNWNASNFYVAPLPSPYLQWVTKTDEGIWVTPAGAEMIRLFELRNSADASRQASFIRGALERALDRALSGKYSPKWTAGIFRPDAINLKAFARNRSELGFMSKSGLGDVTIGYLELLCDLVELSYGRKQNG